MPRVPPLQIPEFSCSVVRDTSLPTSISRSSVGDNGHVPISGGEGPQQTPQGLPEAANLAESNMGEGV